MVSFSKTTVARAFFALSVLGITTLTPQVSHASACDATSAVRTSSASQPTALSITGANVQRSSMDNLWNLVSGTDDTKFRVLGTAIGAANNWMGNCSYPGIGLGVGSGFDYLTRNVTIWLWQDGVNLDLAREAVYELIGENVGSATIAAPDKVLTGQPATFNAANSMPAFTSVSYSWDLNDDGIFETHTGTTSQVTTSFSQAGSHEVHVKATRSSGAFNTASRTVAVMLAPLNDEPGVSILNGSARTNSLNVTVNMVWPAFATAARISNDGAFAFARTTTVPLAESFSWSLEDAGDGIYSTSIYVRFVGPGIDTTRTYVDSIVLDRSSAVTTTTVPAPASQPAEATATASHIATAMNATALVSASSIHTLSLSTLRSGQNPSGRVLNAKEKVCRIINNHVVVLKTGICRLNVTVRAPKGRKTSSVVTISCTNGSCRRQR